MLNIANLLYNYSQDKITSLFYVNNEKILFLICKTDNSSDPKISANKLKEKIKNFSKIASVSTSTVQTKVIGESQSYKNMRVFYTTTLNIPEEAIVLTGKAWTMREFLKL